MATKKTAADIRIENIKTDLRSISTCTATTVTELQALLAEKPEESAHKENLRGKSSQLRCVQTTTRTKTTGSAATVAKQTSFSLAPRERYILATDIANITLKTLAEALKNQSPRALSKANPPPKGDAPKPPNRRPALTQSPSYVQQPLQERSVSHAINSPIKRPTVRRSLSYSSCLTTGPNPGLVATGECARVAFSYLRTPEAVKIAGKEAPALQLENGMLALVGKLVAHHLDHLAIKELGVLKKRLDHFLDAGKAKKDNRTKNARIKLQKAPSDNESLASLLDFGDIDRTTPALPLVITHQTYILRLIAKIRRPSLVEEAWDYVKLSSPSSPGNLIWHTAKASNGDPKIARQLESLSQTALSLCPSISSSEDVSEDQESLQPRPDLVLSFQHFAFKMRQRWWALAKHQANEEKELLEPFSRCVVAFARRSRLSALKKYKVAELLSTDILGAKDLSTLSQRYKGSSMLAVVTQCLSSLAQSAGLPDEALRWLGDSECSRQAGENAAKSAARLVRIATITLDATLNGDAKPGSEEIFANALDSLSSGLSGSSSELDSLFREVNALRRVAAKLLSTSSQANESLSPTRSELLRIVSAGVHFSARYLGPVSEPGRDAKAQGRLKQHILAVAKYVKSIVDSVCVCSKLSVSSEPEEHWKIMNGLSLDCLAILQHFQANDIKLPDELQHPYVKISNAYWTVHLQLKATDGTAVQSILAMQQSVELLRPRPQIEQQAGLLAMKLERLAEALDLANRGEDSRKAFLQCLQAIATSNTMQSVVDLAKVHPISKVFENSENGSTLGRVLKTYNRSFLKDGVKEANELAFFDDVELLAAGRGLLLEWQLALFLKVLSRNRSWNADLNPSVQAIATRLLEIYGPSEFPTRRRRVQIMLLQACQYHPETLSQTSLQLNEQLNFDTTSAKTEDQGLAKYDSHFKALLMLKLSMLECSPSIATIRECCSIWQTLIDSAQSWDDVCNQVDDVEYWLSDLRKAAEYLAAKGEEYLCLPVLHLLVKVQELEKYRDPSQLITDLCVLGVQSLRLGYSGKAGLTFVKAESLASDKNASTVAKLHWHLGYAEYLLETGNSAKCESSLAAAETIARQDKQFMDLAKSSTTLSGRVRFNRILADACYVHSLLATRHGRHGDAARFVRQCVALNRRVWAALEGNAASKRMSPSSEGETDGEASTSNFDGLSSMRNDRGMLLVVSTTHEALDTPDFWPLVPHLYRGLMQQSLIFAHQGLYQEALYVAEQAEKVSLASNSQPLIMENCSRRAELWVQSGRIDKAKTALASVYQSVRAKHLCTTTYYASLAMVLRSNGEFSEELAVYEKMDSLLNDLVSASFIKALDSFSSGLDSLAEQVSTLALDDKTVKAEKVVKRTTRGRKPAAKPPKPPPRTKARAAPKLNNALPDPATEITNECSSLATLRADVGRRKVLVMLVQDKLSQAIDFLDQLQDFGPSLERNILHLWVSYKAMLVKSMKELSSDFTFNTLPESTIAFPAIGEKDYVHSQGVPATKLATTKGTKKAKATKEHFVTTLREARERLVESHSLCAQAGSSSNLQQASYALAQVTILLSAMSNGDARDSHHPLYAAYMSEIPKINNLHLTQESIAVEQESMSRDECLKWPGLKASKRASLAVISDFQKEYIDIIPDTWTVISLALNEDHDELYITRYESGLTPFALRIPLTRHASRDMDEDEFSFDDGKRDFEEIIELSDFSTKTAKDMTSKEARLQWWTERESLDGRLHNLLLNIENVWLGGFKGIFSQHTRQPTLLAQFHKCFEGILDRHLPSRRGKTKTQNSVLDSRVLELFIGLGDATNDDLDLDEALMDLMYFIIDIFQFNGETNAYDEIDFESMVVETLDALRVYHGASKSVSATSPHTILILDKALHLLPWESLPSLQSNSISRLPSLAALRERLLAARAPTATQEGAVPGHYISASAGGTSILNPSGDLVHTTKTLKPRLDSVSGSWTHFVNHVPSEKEFESALKDRDLVLYFGHGSGAQFVRSKSVRRLFPGIDKVCEKSGCATTFLFGCSSAHLTENGIYEPSGMLSSYLVAGAPAVVGMLWDVTDKDCDRFAVKCGELWGLWPEVRDEVVVPKTPGKKAKGRGKVAQLVAEVESARGAGTGKVNKGKNKAVDDGGQMDGVAQQRRRGVGLDEAVRDARDACVLRYLNGAAAVVYGIPVYLE